MAVAETIHPATRDAPVGVQHTSFTSTFWCAQNRLAQWIHAAASQLSTSARVARAYTGCIAHFHHPFFCLLPKKKQPFMKKGCFFDMI